MRSGCFSLTCLVKLPVPFIEPHLTKPHIVHIACILSPSRILIEKNFPSRILGSDLVLLFLLSMLGSFSLSRRRFVDALGVASFRHDSSLTPEELRAAKYAMTMSYQSVIRNYNIWNLRMCRFLKSIFSRNITKNVNAESLSDRDAYKLLKNIFFQRQFSKISTFRSFLNQLQSISICCFVIEKVSNTDEIFSLKLHSCYPQERDLCCNQVCTN